MKKMTTTIKANYFAMYSKINDKMTWPDFFLWALKYHEEKYGLIPDKIIMNKVDIGFLGKNRGIEYKGNRIPINTAKNCIAFNVQFH